MVNYLGNTSDTNECYSEVIANYLLGHLSLLDKIPTISRTSSYNMHHTGLTIRENSNRFEEKLALSLFGKMLPSLGKIIDYQTPLKNVQSDTAGKIDLLAWNTDKEALYLIELKDPESEETILNLVRHVNPTKIIPVHTENATWFGMHFNEIEVIM